MLTKKLEQFVARSSGSPPSVDLSQGALVKLVGELDAQGDFTPPAPKEMYAEVVGQLRSGNTESVRPRKLSRVVGTCMHWLIEESDSGDLITSIWQIARQLDRGSLYRQLLVGCLSCIDVDSKSLHHLASRLRVMPDALGKRWSNRLRQYGLLDEPYGQKVVEHLSAAASPQEREVIIHDSGLQTFRDTGLGTCVYRSWCDNIRRVFENESDAEACLERLQRWSEIAQTDSNFRFTGLDLALGIESLLLPWVHRTPPDILKNNIKNLVLEGAGDPRIKPANWSSVNNECSFVLKRWLAQDSFDVFIRVISKVAYVQHWEQRKKFWGWYLEEGYIQDIWTILASRGQQEIRRVNAQAENGLNLQYGTLSGAQSDHCVLLMHIGDLTVAEWSHNGSVRLWLPTNKQLPSLYNNAYTGDGLRWNSDHAVAHQGSWQMNVSRYIEKHTGISHPRAISGFL